MARKLLRILVKSIRVTTNGDVAEDQKPPAADPEERNNVILATLVYPRGGAPTVVSSLAVNLEDNKTTDFGALGVWDRLLFKEEVESETVLKIQLLDRDRTSKWTRFVALFFGTVLGTALQGVVGGIGNKIVGAVAALPLEPIGKSFKVGEEELIVLGEGKRELFVADALPTPLSIPLKAKETIAKDYWAFAAGGKLVKKSKTLIKKGQLLGAIELECEWS